MPDEKKNGAAKTDDVKDATPGAGSLAGEPRAAGS